MAAENILGISGQMDISDIQQSLDKLINNLNQLGVKTDEVSSRMTKALNDISQSATSDSEKTKQAVSVLKEGLASISGSLGNVPESLKKMSAEAQTAESTIARLNKKLSETQQGSSEWGKINEQLNTQRQYANKLNDEYSTLFNTFNGTQQYIGALNTAIDVLNAGQSVSNAATIVSGVAHAGVASTVALETAAHTKNAEEIGNETQKISENIDATNNAAEASKQRVTNADEELRALQKMAELIKQGSVSEEQFIKAKEDANTRWVQLQEERNNLTKKQEEAQERTQNAYNDMLSGKISSEEYEKQLSVNQQIFDTLQSQKAALSQTMQQIQTGIDQVNAAYLSYNNTQQQVADNSQTSAQKEIDSNNKTKDAIKEKEDELKKLQEQLEQMQAHFDAGWGGNFISKFQKGENPFNAISDHYGEAKEIGNTKEKIAEITNEIEKMKQSAQDAAQGASDMNNELSREDIYASIKSNKNELANITAELNAAKKAGNDPRVNELKKRQKEINKEIDDGNIKLQKMGASYKGMADEAKRAAKETKKIGEGKGDNGLSQLKKMSGEFKSGFNGGFSFSNITKMVTSTTGAYVAAAGAAAYAVKWVSDQNHMLEESMMGLKGYLDSGVLEELREQYVQLEYDSTHSAEEMAAAGTRWVKYFEGIRSSADAISDVTNVSNDFATVLGTTSEKAADYILKIAGAYHQTAAEAKSNSTILINASKKSVVGYEELAQAISSSASRAAQSGATLEEFASAVAYSSASLGGASTAASTYTMLLQRLSSQSNNNFNPAVVGATKALENLAKSNKLNDTLTELLGKRQGKLARVFVENVSAINDMKNGLDDANAAMKVVQATESKLENQEKKLENAKRALAHEINVNLTPAYTGFLEYVATTIKGMGTLAAEIKKQLNPIIKWFNDLDTKFSGSTIWKFLSTLTGMSGLSLIHDMQSLIDGGKSKREKQLTDIYNANLEKVGKQSPGKAYAASIRQIAHNGGVAKTDRDFLRKLNAQQRVENNSRPQGTDNKTGNENEIEDDKAKKREEKRKKAQEQLNEELKKLQQKNIDDELALQEEGTQKKIAQIDNDYKKRLAEIEKQEREFKKKNKEAGEKTNADGLTPAQSSALNQSKIIAQEEYDKKIADVRKEELASMREYLSKYGSLMQQREAIEEDYNEKIKKASNEGAKLSLQKEKESKLAAFEYNSISRGIDWKTLLGGVGNINTEMLKPMLKQLKAFTQTDKFQNADAETQQKVVDLINELKQYVGEQNTTWQELATAMQEFNDAVVKFNDAVEKEKNAKEKKEQAEKDLAAGRITQNEYNEAANNLKEASEYAAEAEKNMRNKGNELNNKNDDVKNYASALTQLLNSKGGTWKSVDGYSNIQGSIRNIDQLKGAFDAAAPEIGEGIGTKVSSTIGSTLSGISSSISGVLSSGIGQIVGFIAQIPKLILQLADAIKNFVTGILNSISTLLKFEWLSDLINSILEAVWNIIDTILDLPENIAKLLENVIVKGIGGLLNNIIGRLANIITFGGVSSGGPASWFTNSNEEEVAIRTRELTESNERLKDSVDNLKTELAKQSGFKAIDTAKQAKQDQEQIIKQTMSILQTQMSEHGAHHSNASEFGLSAAEYGRMNLTLANYRTKNPNAKTTVDSVYSLEDLYKLTPEQMNYLRTYNIEMWKKILTQGKYDKSEYWEAYADLAGSMDEITETLRESLTSTTFDTLKSNFISSLMDMSKSAQDFSDDFSEMLMQSVLNAKISDLMSDDMEAFYKKWADYAESDNTLDDVEIAELKKDWQGFVDKGLKMRDEVASITGYDGTAASQNTGSSSASSMTQDQANELNGRFTALQIAGELQNQYLLQSIGLESGIADAVSVVQLDMTTLRATTTLMSQNLSEMLDIQYESVDKLGKIAVYTSVLPAMNENINNIYRSVKDINRK